MKQHLAPGHQDQFSTKLGWAIFISFLMLFVTIVLVPRTSIGERGFLQLLHDSLGLIVGVLSIIRLYWFFKGPNLKPPRGMPSSSFTFSRAVLFTLILVYAIEFVIGIPYAWGEHGRSLVVFGASIPPPLSPTENMRLINGYLHSTLAFYFLMLFSIWITVGLWNSKKYGVGIARLFPGPKV
jgi:cytochrome b561